MNWWLRYAPFAIALAGFCGVLVYGLWDAASNIEQLRHILVLRIVMSVSITVISLTFALSIILSKKYQPEDKYWAFAAVGIIVGFWLRTYPR